MKHKKTEENTPVFELSMIIDLLMGLASPKWRQLLTVFDEYFPISAIEWIMKCFH